MTDSAAAFIKITVLFFASAREAAGIKETQLLFPMGSDTLDLRNELASQYPKLAPMVLDEDSVTLAINEEYVTETAQLKDGDTVALIPPISGG
jgi:molybdopterin synthase sulfur carrier subunit